MTGWDKVIAATALVVVALLPFNLALWRRLRAARDAAVATQDD